MFIAAVNGVGRSSLLCVDMTSEDSGAFSCLLLFLFHLEEVAGGWLHLNMHEPLTRRSGIGLTVSVQVYVWEPTRETSVETYQGS